jgi:hypothetical protein
MHRTSVILVIMVWAQMAFSQSSLTGKVVDQVTQKPLPFVNVFFANTTIGTVSNETGSFAIRNIPNGKYDLTFSFVGYKTFQTQVNFSGDEQNIAVSLKEEAVQLQEVYVRADTSNWKANFKEFKKYFLGTTQNASRTEIMNPRTVRLYFDPSDKILTARAKSEIEIENKALGYKIIYDLVEFGIDYGQGSTAYFGIPRFEELESSNTKDTKRWDEERKRAYYGSFTHFIRSLQRNQLEASGFEVHTFFRLPNKDRPSDTFLDQRIRYWRQRPSRLNGTMVAGNDSLSYYVRLKSLPKEVDSVGHQVIDVTELFLKGTTNQINYKGMLQVTFKNEREEGNYALDRFPTKHQSSIIHFVGKDIKIYENGYYESARDVFFEGYMGWAEKLADLFPLGYEPAEEPEQMMDRK